MAWLAFYDLITTARGNKNISSFLFEIVFSGIILWFCGLVCNREFNHGYLFKRAANRYMYHELIIILAQTYVNIAKYCFSKNYFVWQPNEIISEKLWLTSRLAKNKRNLNFYTCTGNFCYVLFVAILRLCWSLICFKVI